MKFTPLNRWLLTIGIIMGIILPLYSQVGRGRGRINGQVVNEKGKPIPAARIDMLFEDGITKFSTASDQKGAWAILGLGTGKFKINVSATGYISKIKIVIIRQLQRNEPVTFKLLSERKKQGGKKEEYRDVLINLNFYKGHRHAQAQKPQVISSYYLKPLFVGDLINPLDIHTEKKEICRIFNLTDLELMTSTQWSWTNGQRSKKFQLMVINGHEFLIKVEMKELKDKFNIQVVDNPKGKGLLLDTNIALPQNKSLVFGFEDSTQKPYFLSLHRPANTQVLTSHIIESPFFEDLKQIKKVKPEYPLEAIQKGIEGKVILDAICDTNGKVKVTKVIKGINLLAEAAKNAVEQWQFLPYTKAGKKKAIQFTVEMNFIIPGITFKQAQASKEKNTFPASKPNIWPCRGYLTDGYGLRTHPMTGKKELHLGIDISTHLGQEVKATADGEIVKVANHKIWGKSILIDHWNGYQTYYAHLNDIKVIKNEWVTRGQAIGTVGNTGRSNAPHLHYEIRFNNKHVNPTRYIYRKQ